MKPVIIILSYFSYSFVNSGLCLEELSCGGKSREDIATQEVNCESQMSQATIIKDNSTVPCRRALKNLTILGLSFM